MSRQSQINSILLIVIPFAGFAVFNFFIGENSYAFVFFVITIFSIIIGLINYFLWPDSWRGPLFIIEGNDLLVKRIGVNEMEMERWKEYKPYIKIDEDRRNKLKYLNEINKQRYELIFRGIKPSSIDLYLHNLSENDRNIMREFIFRNYGDKLISNKSNNSDR